MHRVLRLPDATLLSTSLNPEPPTLPLTPNPNRLVRLGMDLSDAQVPRSPNEIEQLEEMHSVADAYLWLGLHFNISANDAIFVEMEQAQEVRQPWRTSLCPRKLPA